MIKKGLLALSIMALVACGGEPSDTTTDTEVAETKSSTAIEQTEKSMVSGSEGVEASKSENWEHIVNNALRTADSYAVKNNPSATYIGNDRSISLDKQMGGQYEGGYLLTIVNGTSGNISYAQLKPLFDINSSVDDLDDDDQLWEVVIAKYNGKEF